MGLYINPGNSGFERITKANYVDKTGLIGLMNERVGTTDGLVCVSRPRRFGKSYAAQMLSAYYDCSCDSGMLFSGYEIADNASFEEHMNQYNVICFDVTSFLSFAKRKNLPVSDVPDMIAGALYKDLINTFPDLDSAENLTDALILLAEGNEHRPGRKCIFIIDEWDALIREAGETGGRDIWLNLLREWFKNISFTPKVVAAAYMTGILPIKKDGSQSAISDFHEFSMLYPDGFAEYTGFTESDVRQLSEESGISFDELRQWYDGYDFPECGSVYNPYSVMNAVRQGKCRSYWQKTSAAESLMTYVRMNFEGLQEIIARLIAGEEIEVSVDGFENDFDSFADKDDVLTLLIHLGYLTYREDDGTVRIPNEEIRAEFRYLIKRNTGGSRWVELMRRSRDLLSATLAGDGNAVAKRISDIRTTQYAPAFYNNEQALRYIIKFAYIAAIEEYWKAEEVPSGTGIAYDAAQKEHSCMIERWEKV